MAVPPWPWGCPSQSAPAKTIPYATRGLPIPGRRYTESSPDVMSAPLHPRYKRHRRSCHTACHLHRESAACLPSPYTSATCRSVPVHDASLSSSPAESAFPSEHLSAPPHPHAAPAAETAEPQDVPEPGLRTGAKEDTKDITRLPRRA